MVLKAMADFGKSWKSLQTLWNASKTLLKWFLTPCATVCVDFGWIRKGRNLADFEQKGWAIAHGFEHCRFWQHLEIAPNSLKRFLNPRKMISNPLRDCLCRFWMNSQGSTFRRFWAKSLGYSPWFWTWPIWPVQEIAPNTLKRFLNPPKMISNSLRDCLCRFRVNSQGSKFGRFWAKSLGYSPWFWTWPILASPGNRSKLSETLPKPS